jgi:hypothetical protein
MNAPSRERGSEMAHLGDAVAAYRAALLPT